MNQVNTDAIMLKRLNYGEADRIITLSTAEKGKISVLAKGVRKTKSKLAGGLELFSLTSVTYIDGKSDLKTVISTKLQKHYRRITADYNRTMVGYEFLKVIDAYTEHTDEPEYFHILQKGLEALDNTELSEAVSSVWYHSAILQLFGGNINLENPLGEKPFTDEQLYNFSYDDMSFFEHPSGIFTPNHIKYLRLVVRADIPDKLLSVVGGEELARTLAPLLSQLTTMHKA